MRRASWRRLGPLLLPWLRVGSWAQPGEAFIDDVLHLIAEHPFAALPIEPRSHDSIGCAEGHVRLGSVVARDDGHRPGVLAEQLALAGGVVRKFRGSRLGEYIEDDAREPATVGATV